MPATPFQRMLRHAARRDLLALAIRRAGWWLVAACGVSLLLLLIDRWFGINLSVWAYAVIVGLGVIPGFIHAALTRHDHLQIAIALDRSLRLKDRVGSALAMEKGRSDSVSSPHDAGFAEMVRQDAASLAGRIDIAAATPIHVTGVWGVALLLALALWAGVMFLPNFAQQRDRLSEAELAAAQLREQQTQQEARQVADSLVQATQDVPRDAGVTDQATVAQLEALDRLAEQLNSASPKNAEEVKTAREDSAARLDDLANRLSQQAQRELEAMQEMQERFNGLDDADLPKAPMTAEEFAAAIKRGDFGAAGEQLEHLFEESQHEYTEAERAAAAEMMRDLAEQIESANEDSNATADERREQVREALREMGVDEETADRLLEPENQDSPPVNAEEAARELRERGVDEEVAERMARDIEDLREQRERDEQVEEETRDLSEAVDRAADAVEKGEPLPPASPQSQPSEGSPSGAQSQPDDAQQPDQSPPTQPAGDEQQTGDDQRQDSREQSGQSQQSSNAQPASQPRANQDERQTTRPEASTQPDETGAGERREQQQREVQGEQGSAQQDRDSQSRSAGAETRPIESREPSTAQTQPDRQPGAQRSPQTEGQSSQREEASPDRAPGAQSQLGAGEESPAQSQPQTDADMGEQQQSRQARDQQEPQQHQQQQRQQQPGESTSEQLPDISPDQLPDPDSIPGDVLRRLAERAREAQNDQQTSERLREMARKLADNMTPEQRQRWTDALQRELGDQPQPPGQTSSDQQPPEDQQSPDPDQNQGGTRPPEAANGAGENEREPPSPIERTGSGDDSRNPTGSGANDRAGTPDLPERRDSDAAHLPRDKTEDVDLRGDETADRLIAQWLSDAPPDEATAPARSSSSSPGAAQRLEAAQKIAERAVNDAAVNKRYHRAIKRYFGRLPQTIDRAARGEPLPQAASQPSGGP